QSGLQFNSFVLDELIDEIPELDYSEMQFLGKIPHLTKLTMDSRLMLRAIPHFPSDNQINSIHVSGTIIPSVLVKAFPKLRQLYLDPPSNGVEFRLNPLANLSQLTHLTFSPWGGSPADVDAIIKNLADCEHLESLFLTGDFSSS